jgi:hypothetical protein
MLSRLAPPPARGPPFAATEQPAARSYSGGPQARCSSRLSSRSVGAMTCGTGCRPPTRVSAKDGSSGGAAISGTIPSTQSSRAASGRHSSPSQLFPLAAMSSESWPKRRLKEEPRSSRPRAGPARPAATPPAGRRASSGVRSSPSCFRARGGLAAVGFKRSGPTADSPTDGHRSTRATANPWQGHRGGGVTMPRAQRPAGRGIGATPPPVPGGNPRCGR